MQVDPALPWAETRLASARREVKVINFMVTIEWRRRWSVVVMNEADSEELKFDGSWSFGEMTLYKYLCN